MKTDSKPAFITTALMTLVALGCGEESGSTSTNQPGLMGTGTGDTTSGQTTTTGQTTTGATTTTGTTTTTTDATTVDGQTAAGATDTTGTTQDTQSATTADTTGATTGDTQGTGGAATTDTDTGNSDGAAGSGDDMGGFGDMFGGGDGGAGSDDSGDDMTAMAGSGSDDGSDSADDGGDDTSGNVAPGDPDPSEGCGMAAPAECVPCQANGLDYYVDMPDNYDSNRAYPVVFQYHPLGGTGQGARTMYRVRPDFPDAIYVSPDGSDNGFPNGGGVDEEVTREIMVTIEATLCVDRARYFATGFSYGGSMSYTAACNMSDKFRAVAAMAGAPISGANCTREEPERPVAVMGIHGEADTALPITMAEPIIETWLEKNGCTGDPQPSDLTGSDCATVASALATGEYQGCQEGYPVIWCPIPDYPHNIPSWSGGAIAAFFQLF